MYNRFDKGMHPKQCVLDQLLGCLSQKVTLEDNASHLENVSHRPLGAWRGALRLNFGIGGVFQPMKGAVRKICVVKAPKTAPNK